MRVLVIGAGVIGITSAVAVKENFPLAKVTVIGEKFSPETTGDGSAGLWSPYLLANTDPDNITHWALLTLQWMETFWKNGLAKETGISLVPIYRVTSDSKGYSLPTWSCAPYGLHELTAKEICQLNKSKNSKFTGGIHYLAYICEPTRLLPWLMQKFVSMGGKIIRQRVSRLKEFDSNAYDVIINCTGLGARYFVGDQSVFPIRGQVMRVEAPWLLETFLSDDQDGNYIIPNIDCVILGGTHQENDNEVHPREEDSRFIFKGCKRLYPSVSETTVLKEWVGFRPGRDKVRLESEIIYTLGGKSTLVNIMPCCMRVRELDLITRLSSYPLPPRKPHKDGTNLGKSYVRLAYLLEPSLALTCPIHQPGDER
ncbi:hypothetical protein QAD02_004802 [Eretmocerus hayati]|uniref:Uncharacterized protein n=1 Tax=Eretmocerus hayati TaxID=131215 RepID=A0ACC2NQK0_9HYME|nr:hypothetical protein QAD02_004802 [Eretmocerus hayati]